MRDGSTACRGLAGPLRMLWDEGTVATLDDGALLRRFARGEGAELAFEAMVRRHGPMVLRVCRAMLGDRHAAEDAFQAVFLVLARKANSIREPDRLGPWLHGVAIRSAREARSRDGRRRKLERRGAGATASATEDWPGASLARIEAVEALHRAIDRLPERYRAPLVLCDLEGLTHREAAGRLQCPEGTVGVRLMRARQRLRDRLGRQPDPSVMAVGTADLPGGLADLVARSAMGWEAAAGTVPTPAITLARGVLKAMMLAKWKLATAVAMASASIAIGGWAGATGGQGVGVGPAPARAQAARPADDFADVVGVVEAIRREPVKARVSGLIANVPIQVGSKVAKGDALVEIDPKPYRAQLELAEARVEGAEARSKLAIATLARAKILLDRKVASQAEFDKAEAERDATRTDLADAKVGRDRAKLDLESTTLRAPIDGLVATRDAVSGNLAKAGESLAEVVSMDPIGIAFEVDEPTLLKVRRLAIAREGDPAKFPVRAGLSVFGEIEGFPRTGRVDLGSARPSKPPGRSRLVAEFANPDVKLKLGLLARLRLDLTEPTPAGGIGPP